MTTSVSITKSLDGEEASANGKQSNSLEVVGPDSVPARQAYTVPECWEQLVQCSLPLERYGLGFNLSNNDGATPYTNAYCTSQCV